jgi:DNA-binding response OmpR family regulator
MAATLGGTGHGPARARSTPGQNRADGSAGGAAPVSVGGVPSPGILVVEDDDAIASGLVRVLEAQGFPVRRLARGGPATAAADAGIGLVLLDLGLPDVDGVEVCRRLRRLRPELAILILTARDHELDVVTGLDAGADDYLVKPFRLSELLARVRAHLRRATAAETSEAEPLAAGPLRVEPASRRAWCDGEELALRPKEFDLLALFVAEAGRVVTRERIMREVWDTEWLGSTKTLDTHVLSLRNKVGAGAITTLRGVGYRLELR